ncbi:MAG TPA: saccharopine dehydrogenase C-terminal domain-containing protein [Planctomycetota bacterium]|nr:saccharopine dehydrogenase C-terminal domain-containing protein [Planctomycetota bacterium]
MKEGIKFDGKVLIIGLGAVSRCTIPLLMKHIDAPPDRFIILDFADVEAHARPFKEMGANFVKDRVTRENMSELLSKHVGSGDIIIDLAWNIGCTDILQWCYDHNVRYLNTSVELWDPYEGAPNQPPTERTLYARQMSIRKMVASWKPKRGATAVLDHGANPGLVSHFTKAALEDIAQKWLSEHNEQGERRQLIEEFYKKRMFNRLAHLLDVKVIHISERDTQISNVPKELNEFVNTWSIEGFYEEGIAPAEMGWGTHERTLPPRAQMHLSGPMNQICIANMGCRTWVRSWVPCGEIVGMVIRHGEAFSISENLTVREEGMPVYRPTVHYAYCPCDAAIASLHELQMRHYNLQPKLRIMNDEITDGRDELGCLLMGHDYKSWWIGSKLDIHEARKLVPGQNATTLQVACSVMAATLWMIKNPTQGVCVPDDLPHREILATAKPYLGPFVSEAVDWTPLKNWHSPFERYGTQRPPDEDVWQFNTFLVRGLG